MKILHVSKKYPDAIGGDANVVRNLELHQRKAGHEVIILTTNCREIAQNENVIKCGIPDSSENYDRITLKRIVSLMILFFASFRILYSVKPDIIHSHSADMGFLVSFPAAFFHIPIINTCHGVCFNDKSYPSLKRFLETFFLKYGAFRCISTVDKNSLPDFAGQAIRNVVYIPNGVDGTLFSAKRSSSNTGTLKFLFVGRLEHQKGLDVLIEAVKCLKEINDGFEVVIVGDGSLKEDLIRQITDYSLKSTIYLAGNVNPDELLRQYTSSDAFILPSRWEGMPLTLLEAWAVGLPAIVTNVGGITALCKDMDNAVIIEPEDSQALCNGMRFLIENPDIAEKLGSKGKDLVRARYSWDSIGKQYQQVYRHFVR